MYSVSLTIALEQVSIVPATNTLLPNVAVPSTVTLEVVRSPAITPPERGSASFATKFALVVITFTLLSAMEDADTINISLSTARLL